MANFEDYQSRLQQLTQQNLDILGAINESFFTKRTHLEVTVNDNNGNSAEYVLPSFPALENKVNALQESIDSIVNAPKTGEATVYLDSGTKTIELRSYTNTPSAASINLDSNSVRFKSVPNNEALKDILAPNTYVKFDLKNLPDDINSVCVRKVVFNDNLSSVGGSVSALSTVEWPTLNSMLASYTKDEDYIIYDKTYKLPTRSSLGTGTYTIKTIGEDSIDSNLDEYIELTLFNDLKYSLFDGTTEQYLTVGDQLVTGDDSAKMEIVDLDRESRWIKVKVLNGDYLNLAEGSDSDVISLSQNNYTANSVLKIYKPADYDKYKYVNIPVTDNKKTYIFIAPLNDRMNIRSEWGKGVLLNPDYLYNEDDETVTLSQYYDKNVVNIGEVLLDIASSAGNSISKFSQAEFDELTQCKPDTRDIILTVLKINSHLDNTTTIQSIRELYSQKQDAALKRDEAQRRVNEINNKLSSTSFTDTTSTRIELENELSTAISTRNTYSDTVNKLATEINALANDSVTPIENAKYRIRGYFDFESNNNNTISKYVDHIKAIKVQYHYKNQNNSLTSSTNIDEKFIYSDWIDMPISYRYKQAKSAASHKFSYPDYNSGENVPKFNQIEIPITQGEIVEVRVKVIWDFGAPFIENTSDWSELVQISFPEEFLKDVPILTIIDENNSDIESSKFTNILSTAGVISHVEDKLIDQDVSYFHQPNHIASGFYTDERRVIPLFDKLKELDASLVSLADTIYDSNSNNIKCSVLINNVEYDINENSVNSVYATPYQDTDESKNVVSHDYNDAGTNQRIHTETAILRIKNNSSTHIANLYSLFPGKSDVSLGQVRNTHTKYDTGDYTFIQNGYYLKDEILNKSTLSQYKQGLINIIDQGVWLSWYEGSEIKYGTQTANQWITFRGRDIMTGRGLYMNMSNNNTPINDVGLFEGFSAINGEDYNFTLENPSNVSVNPGIWLDFAQYCASPLEGTANTNTSRSEANENTQLFDYKFSDTEKGDTCFLNKIIGDYFEELQNQNGTIKNNDTTQGIAKVIQSNLQNCFEYGGNIADVGTYHASRMGRFNNFLIAYPCLKDEDDLKISKYKYSGMHSKLTLNPGEVMEVPITIKYAYNLFTKNATANPSSINRKQAVETKISFDLRTSLYSEPINYTFRIIAPYETKSTDTFNYRVVSSSNTSNNVTYSPKIS